MHVSECFFFFFWAWEFGYIRHDLTSCESTTNIREFVNPLGWFSILWINKKHQRICESFRLVFKMLWFFFETTAVWVYHMHMALNSLYIWRKDAGNASKVNLHQQCKKDIENVSQCIICAIRSLRISREPEQVLGLAMPRSLSPYFTMMFLSALWWACAFVQYIRFGLSQIFRVGVGCALWN